MERGRMQCGGMGKKVFKYLDLPLSIRLRMERG
jgi:hypothetical protein